MATYAIGDVQGCFSFLMLLLEKINFNPKSDKLWFVGDLVNRGPESLETLRFIKNLGNQAIVVLGNHDISTIAIASGAVQQLKNVTIDDILHAKDKVELIEWLRHQPLIYKDAALNYTMVHAGIPPQWTIDEAIMYAHSVEQELQSNYYVSFLHTIFNMQPQPWSKNLSVIEKQCYTINALSRIRFCDSDGTLNLFAKGSNSEAPVTTQPWFELLHQDNSKENIIFGHWAALKGYTKSKHVFGLDTGCVWQGELTAMCLETHNIFSVSCKN